MIDLWLEWTEELMTTHSWMGFGQDFFHHQLRCLELWCLWQKTTKRYCWPIDQGPAAEDCERQHL